MVNKLGKKVTARIELAMALAKAEAEKKVTGQSYDLHSHSLKFLIHVDSYNGDYNYWQKDIGSTLQQITDSATNVKGSKELKRSWVVNTLFNPWENERTLKRELISLYKDSSYSNMKKRFTLEEVINRIDLDKVKHALKLLVDELYDNEESSYLEMATYYFNQLKPALPDFGANYD